MERTIDSRASVHSRPCWQASYLGYHIIWRPQEDSNPRFTLKMKKKAIDESTRHADRDVVIGEQGAVTRNGAEQIRSRLLEGRLNFPLSVRRRLRNEVGRRPRRVRVRPRIGPRLHLLGAESHRRGLASVDDPRQPQAGSAGGDNRRRPSVLKVPGAWRIRLCRWPSARLLTSS